jgi:uncharacterized protein YkwD
VLKTFFERSLSVMQYYLIHLVVILFLQPFTQEQNESNADICLSANERELAILINEYRSSKGLDKVPISKSLSRVAQLHARDLVENEPFDENKCNPHSWSTGKSWEACCYDSGHSNPECMWDKPRQITDYSGDGYEIIMASIDGNEPTREVSAEKALNSWKGSPNHNAAILNKNTWKKVEWLAMGVGIYQGYAAVWFGREPDEAGSPAACP